jgi:hypothetical protein
LGVTKRPKSDAALWSFCHGGKGLSHYTSFSMILLAYYVE